MPNNSRVVVVEETLEEALAAAEKELGRPREEIDYRVLEEARSGLFNRRGMVKIEARLAAAVDGMAAIVDGQLVVIPPQNGGRPARVTPGPHVLMWYQGEEVTGAIEIVSGEGVTWQAEESAAESRAEIEVSSDGLRAVARVYCRAGEVYRVRDAPPAPEITVQAELVHREERRFTRADLAALLAQQGVVYGIDWEAVDLAVSLDGGKEVEVARGVPAELPQDDQLICYFEEKMAEMAGRERTDYLGEHLVLSVEAGEVLAARIPGKPGQPGTNVYGRPIDPGRPKEIKLRAGKGVELAEGGNRAVATTAGRPARQGNMITVWPVYTLTGQVDAHTGRVSFKGDVVVQGDVLDGMYIEAEGQVQVTGFVANAQLIAGGNIVVGRNMVGTTARAGGMTVAAQWIQTTVENVTETLTSFKLALEQVCATFRQHDQEAWRRRGEGSLVKALLESKYPSLLAMLEKLGSGLKKSAGEEPEMGIEPLMRQTARLQRQLSGLNPLQIRQAAELQAELAQWEELKEEVLKNLARLSGQVSDIVVPYAQSSMLQASGKVLLTGKGAYNCRIQAGGDVVINGSPGVFRGGEIVAQGNVLVRELGSPAEIATSVEVPRKKYIRAQKAYPGVFLKAGARVQRVTTVGYVELSGDEKQREDKKGGL